ncbi:hypothetical protein MKW92_042179 [Papaver armeniacum]|nr:hypothetical protein MKW92_042179 [Papaver armeniacum]
MAIFSAFSRKFQIPLSFISFIFGLAIDILDTISAPHQQFELDLLYRRRTRSGHLTTRNLSSSFSAAEMTKKILPIMKSEDLPTISNSTDLICSNYVLHSCSINTDVGFMKCYIFISIKTLFRKELTSYCEQYQWFTNK